MEQKNSTDNKQLLLFLASVLIVGVGAAFVYGYMRMSVLSEQIQQLGEKLDASNALHAEKAEALAQDISSTNDLALQIARALSDSNQTVQQFQETIGQISGSVETLEKLSKTDPELLQKYSKVYFLNEHYAPERLVQIDQKYVYSNSKPELVHALVWPSLQKLLAAAKGEGVTLYIKSGYRSFEEQRSVKSTYSVTFGTGTASQFSADQGYSEHQLGTTVDFITAGLGGQVAGFEKTQAYQWLQNNAHRYGFTLSYPPNNAYYIFEPWHWRFVGVTLATSLHEQNNYFYDLEQREIDEYLVSIFD